jgi:hypothetical protein
MVQRLLMHPGQAGRHRLNRLPPPVEHQPLQIPTRPVLPPDPRQRSEHITGVLDQIFTQPLSLNNVHTLNGSINISPNSPSPTRKVTKHY